MTIIEPRTAIVSIYGGDYHSRLAHLSRQIDEAEKVEASPTRLMSDEPASHALVEKYNALAAEAEKSAVDVRIQAVRRSVYRELAAAHPPRTDESVQKAIRDGDARLNVNESTFREVLVPAAIVEVGRGDVMRKWSEFSEEERVDFLDTITEADMEALFINAFVLVNNLASSPKARVSPPIQKSDETPN